MNILEPAKDWTTFAVQNVLLIACLIYISYAVRWDPRALIGLVYIAIVLLSLVQLGVEWLQNGIEDE